MLAEVTITLSDWLIDELKAIVILFCGMVLGYVYGYFDFFGQVREIRAARRARRARRQAVQR
jgi:uncharacterized integral membrane protein